MCCMLSIRDIKSLFCLGSLKDKNTEEKKRLDELEIDPIFLLKRDRLS